MTDSWYARPVFNVADIDSAVSFYVDKLGFWQKWPEPGSGGTVRQVNRGDVEIILCQDEKRRDKARMFLELNDDQRAELRRMIAERAIRAKETWWGYDCIQIDDPDGNELLFPVEG